MRACVGGRSGAQPLSCRLAAEAGGLSAEEGAAPLRGPQRGADKKPWAAAPVPRDLRLVEAAEEPAGAPPAPPIPRGTLRAGHHHGQRVVEVYPYASTDKLLFPDHVGEVWRPSRTP